MEKTLRICAIQPAYLQYLRVYDPFVSLDPTGNRKFVGIILEVNGHKYCAPLSSPKPKHSMISEHAPDVVKIDGGKLGVINLNNMIPIHDSAIIDMDISQVADAKYRGLLTNQALFIRSKEEAIKKKASRLHSMIKSKKHPSLHKRCCDFLALEAAVSNFGAVTTPTVDVAVGIEQNDT
ncbi:type III toxin-antitoxin system ToxN/AbiQ family toxin [Cohnella fermenti]|uniref:Type III toxin-antitoxin system ToxN/AbiQ family toxin n=1 Tax=Cohnella fermenti TaxID=2565925 RepID=A0A4S4BXD9_9BACL|nr:type III toxin-antitoxin system ToxN/AbiQ family toxin [Cohnella fermenti]THF77787.1 type III toxin-antitoxin system ToxN/AbiQ family toxin [Cohnella fermenti]